MKKEQTTLTRVNKDTNDYIKNISRKLSLNENKTVPVREVIRRTFRIPSVEEILIQDSYNKRRQR